MSVLTSLLLSIASTLFSVTSRVDNPLKKMIVLISEFNLYTVIVRLASVKRTGQANLRSTACPSIPPWWCTGRRWARRTGCCRTEWCRNLGQASHLCTPCRLDTTWTAAHCHTATRRLPLLVEGRDRKMSHNRGSRMEIQLLSFIPALNLCLRRKSSVEKVYNGY